MILIQWCHIDICTMNTMASSGSMLLLVAVSWRTLGLILNDMDFDKALSATGFDVFRLVLLSSESGIYYIVFKYDE